MRELSGNERADTSAELAKVGKSLEDLSVRLSAHNDLEEAEIYPLIDLIIEPAEAVTLRARIKSELENLPPRFVGRM